MAIYEIEAPNGKILEIEGDNPPSEAELDNIFAETNTSGNSNEPLRPKTNRRIDIRPSAINRNLASAMVSPLYALKNKSSLKEGFNTAKNILEENKSPLNDSIVDIASTFALPEVKLAQAPAWANRALTGAYQGGLIGGAETLANEGDLSGAKIGAIGGSALTAGIPLVGKGISKMTNWLAPRFASSLGGVTLDTIKQAIRPNSNALDMNADQAQALLLDTTQKVRDNYNNLLASKGQKVNEAANKLRENNYRVPVDDLQTDITNIFDQYSGEKINPARNMTGNLENNLIDLVNSAGGTFKKVSPIDLQKIKQQIGHMVNWSDETARNYQNPILEQLYNKYNERLSSLSPELAQANNEFSNIAKYKKNEGLRRILKAGDNIDNASSALKNYKSTVTKGNIGRNVQDLENVLVKNGSEPFLNTVDDINATMDLENSLKTGRNFMGATDLAKQVLLRPTLRGARAINRFNANHPTLINGVNNFKNFYNAISPKIVPLIHQAPKLIGGISNTEVMPIQLDKNGQLIEEY